MCDRPLTMNDISVRHITPDDYGPLFRLVKDILSESDAQKAPYFNEEFWRWQCLTPGFESVVTVAEEGDKLVGSFHLVSREMFLREKKGRMVLLHDLGVLEAYRRRGLFLRLAQCAVEHVTERGWDMTYSLPNEKSYPGFIKHLEYTHVTVSPVYIRPLHPEVILAERLPFAGIWKVLGRTAMGFYDSLRPLNKQAEDLTISPVPRFSSEVDDISRQFVARAGLGCTRDANFLNWRFVDHPGVDYDRWEIRRENKLLAYLVTRVAKLFGADVLLLMDMACEDDEDDALMVLISERLQAARDQGLALGVLMGLHPFFSQVRGLAFYTIPEGLNPRPMNFIVRPHVDHLGDEIYDPSNWCITLA
ncbi:MAG: GNAT family N-acetyltransferase, partial [Deltaproteobacteria bacterium]|nr:GNAT family N-acetyltransferase [Deltaproteobacteria bacterium]